MASLNRVLLIGNLTRDPELRYIPSGTAVVDLGLAINRDFTDKAGEKREETCFVDITVWGRQAETCSQYLRKGRSVFVEGRLQLDSWEGKDGTKQKKLRVVADRVQFLGGPRTEEGGGGAAPARQPEPAARPAAKGPARVSEAPDAAPPDDLNLDDIPF